MYSIRRRVLSQNFLRSRKLVEKLVRQSSLGQKDIVIDIGAGRGIITDALLHKVRSVIAIELDYLLYRRLQNRYYHKSVHVIHTDFLNYSLPRYPYKVFANIPFSIEGKIIRKLLTAQNPPDVSYLVIRKDLAERLGGFKRECQFSIMYKPWFDFQIIHQFSKTDFEPAARMETVLFRMTKRNTPLIFINEKKNYMMFIGQGFGSGKMIKQSLSAYLSYEQLKRLGKHYGFSPKDRPTKLNLKQWVNVYKFYKSYNGYKIYI